MFFLGSKSYYSLCLHGIPLTKLTVNIVAAIILGAIGTKLYAQHNQDGSLIGIGAFDQTKPVSIGGINVFGDGTSPYWIEHQIPIFINQQVTASLEFQVPGLQPAEIMEAEFFTEPMEA